MSSPHEDKPGAGDTTAPGGGVGTSPTTPAPALVSVSGPVAPPGEGTWGNGPGLHVRYAGRTAVGLVREHNEDNFVIANLTSGERGEREASLTDVVGEGGLLFAVCDGMGGAAAGEVASQMAVDVLHESMRRGGFPKERDVLARRLVSAVEEAGRRIFDAAQKERSRRGMGTTATAAVLIDKVLFLAEVGDSRAYLLRNGQLKQLTKDQSLVNQLIEAGHLTEAEAEAFEHSNIILQALGTSETVQVDLTFVELRRGDRLMLCSDGLSGLVHGDTLRDTLSAVDDPAECTAALIRFAEASGGHDNITVVVIDFDGEALELPQETDSFGYLQYPLMPASNAASTFADEEVTEASKPLSFASYEAMPAYAPPSGPRVDSNPWLWASAGLAALLIGAWLLALGDSAGSAATALEAEASRSVVDDGALGPGEPLPSSISAPSGDPSGALQAEPQPEAMFVPVHVHSDVDDAVLLVNGEPHGPLVKGEPRDLELPPGEYRFEAQHRGTIAATQQVTLERDSADGQEATENTDAPTPVDVFLHLPTGAGEPSGGSLDARSGDQAVHPSEPAQRVPASPEHKPRSVAGPKQSATANKPATAAKPAPEAAPNSPAPKPGPSPNRIEPVPAPGSTSAGGTDTSVAKRPAGSTTSRTTLHQAASVAKPKPPAPATNSAPTRQAEAPAPPKPVVVTPITAPNPATKPKAATPPQTPTPEPSAPADSTPDSTKPESPIPENPF